MSKKKDTPEDAMDQLLEEFEAKLAALGDTVAQDVDLSPDDVTNALIGGMLTGLEKMAEEDEGFSFDFEVTDVLLEAKLGAAFWAGDDARMQAVAAENEDPNEEKVEDARSSEEIKWAETAEKLAFIGVDPAVMGRFEDVIPDRYGGIRAGKSGAVDTFLATGQDPNVPTGYDRLTALFAALDAPGRNVADIQKLIDAGADANYVYDQCDSAFSYMANYDHPDTVNVDSEVAIARLLGANGADIEHNVPLFGTALQSAVTRAHPSMIKALLAAGADANQLASEDIQFDFLAGASMLALAAPRPEIVQLLLDHGADPNRVDEYDVRAVEFLVDQIDNLEDERLNDNWTKALVTKLKESHALIEAAAS